MISPSIQPIADNRGVAVHPGEDVLRPGGDDEEIGREPRVVIQLTLFSPPKNGPKNDPNVAKKTNI